MPSIDFLAGGGEMGARIRAFDWTKTPLGPPESWPQSLKTIVRVMLDSRYAMWMLWGSELTFFCNDAYLPTVGLKRDWVLGARSDKVWEEIWQDLWPRIEQVLEQGQATWDEGLLLFLERSGFPEETYHTFSYSPVYDDANSIAGMLCVVTEVTQRVIGERRLHVLRDLAAQRSSLGTMLESCRRCCEVLGRHRSDVPFAALYLVDADGTRAVLAARAGPADDTALPESVSLADADAQWPLAAALRDEAPLDIDLDAAGIRVLASPWPELVQHARLLPLLGAGEGAVAGVLILGVSPRRAFDADYRDFLGLIAGQVGGVLADAQASEAERARAHALAELDRAKTAFFSNVSHEFRTPLTLMLGPLEESLATSDLPATVRDHLERTQHNAQRLLKLVNSLLDFSRIEAGRVQAQFEPTALAALTRDLASSFRSAIERAGLSFDVQCDDLGEVAYVDRDMWEKIVLNLLSNAFKFTLEGGISVRLKRIERNAVLEVADTGVGVPAAEVPRLFERFHRVESTRGRTHEGSGIGLALVNELVRLHGGSIDVSSTPGVGTAFRVELPLGLRHLPPDRVSNVAAAPAASRSARVFIDEAVRWLPDELQLAPAATADFAPAAATDRRFASTFGSRILLADDNADMRAYLRELLAPFYFVEMAVDGESAAAAARRQRPDLILTDVMMPRLDGFGLLRELRAEEALRDVPVILLSARAGEEARIEGLDAGADDYLVKPFAARELLARVGALLELTRMRAENEARLRLALSSVQDQFFLLDSQWRYTLVNPRVTEFAQRSEAELLGRSVFEVFPGARGTKFETELAAARSTGHAQRFEGMLPPAVQLTGAAANSGQVWFEVAIYPAADGVAVLVTDITARKSAEQALRRRTEQFEALLTKAPIGVYLIDADFRLREVNPIARVVFGDIPNLIGRDFAEILHLLWPVGYATKLVERFRNTLDTGVSYVSPQVSDESLARRRATYSEWQIHRIPLPDGRFGIVCYFRDISPQTHARIALLDQRRQLEEADRQKDQFLAMLAHELRNPLAPIRNAGELLARVIPDDSRAQPMVGMIKRQVTQLTRLVDDLLDVSRITRGRIDLKFGIVDLGQVVSQALETVDGLLKSKQQQVTLVASPRPLCVNGDLARLVQCVVNVLANAAKYTDVGGQIHIVMRASGALAIIEISDTGVGIPADLLPQIFDLFVQGDRTLDRAQGGLGIGLSVVKGLLGMHGGQVHARSEGFGRGSCFTLSLPLAAGASPAVSESPPESTPPRAILVVDDNVDAANSLAALLSLDGHKVVVAYGARQALEHLVGFAPDIALLDIGLPEMDGYELARRIRTLPQLGQLRLLALTGYGQEEDRRRAVAAGFDGHLVKPVDIQALTRALRGE